MKRIIAVVFIFTGYAGAADPREIQDAKNCLIHTGPISYQARKDRAIVLTVKDELNLLRDWIMQFKAEVDASISLADLKTRVAGLPNMPQRTSAQAKTSIENKIEDQDSD